MESNSSGSIIGSSTQVKAIRIENPFTLKVGQVFTGFGIGCGIGIGVGRPLNLGNPLLSLIILILILTLTMDWPPRIFNPKTAHTTSPNNHSCAIPMLNQVMSAASGATHAFSGVTRHVNTSLRKLGAKNIEAGVGCGVGFGHGFGVGLAVKPGVLSQIQSSLVIAMTKMMMKFGMTPNLPFGPGALPTSLQSGLSTLNSNQTSAGSMMQLATKGAGQVSQGLAGSQPLQIGSAFENTTLKGKSIDTTFESRTEKVLSNFLQNPLLKGEGEGHSDVGGSLRSENNLLQMVLKHQQKIEQLMEENEKLRQILVEDLKIPSSKLQTSSSDDNNPNSKRRE